MLDIFVSSRADLQNAIENENYTSAAELRDEISKLEADSLAASVIAQAYENAKYAFRLGQKVRHKTFGTILSCLFFFDLVHYLSLGEVFHFLTFVKISLFLPLTANLDLCLV